MGAILAWFAALAPLVVPIVRRALAGIGFGLVMYAGVSTLWDSIQSQVWTNLSASGSSILTILGLARVDDAIKVVFSALSTKLILNGLTATGIIRPRWKFID